MTRALRGLLRFALLLGAVARLAWSYIDPNTGGMLFQVLIVLFGLASGFILFFSRQIRMGFARLSRFFRGIFSHQ